MLEWIQEGKRLAGQKTTTPQERAIMNAHLQLLEVEAAGLTEITLALPKGIRVFDISISAEQAKELKALQLSGGLHVGTSARDIIGRALTSSSEKPQTLSLAAMNSRTMEMGVKKPTDRQVWGRAKKFGDEISAQAMIQVAIEAAKDKIKLKRNEVLVGVMKPITDSRVNQSVLFLRRYEDGELWLHAAYTSPAHKWYPDTQFVVSSRPPKNDPSK